jgi:hypothetical protein
VLIRPVIIMAEIRRTTGIRNWVQRQWRRLRPQPKPDRTKRSRKAYSARFRYRYSKTHRELFPGFSLRFPALQQRLNYHRAPRLFQTRLLHGIGRIYGDAYRFLSRFSNPTIAHFTIFTRYAELCEENIFTNRFTQRVAEEYLKISLENNRRIDYLANKDNLKYFLKTLDLLVAQYVNNHTAALNKHSEGSQYNLVVRALIARINAIFENDRLERIKIEGQTAHQRQKKAAAIRDKQLLDKKAEAKKLEIKLAELEKMVEQGKIIDETITAINGRDTEKAAALAAVNSPVVDAVCQLYAGEALELLIQSAIHMSADKGQKNVNRIIDLAVTAARKIAKSSKDNLLAQLLTELKDGYGGSFIQGPNLQADRSKAAVIQEILMRIPEAAPYLLQEHTENYSWFRKAVNFLLRTIRINRTIHDYASDMLEPIIVELLQSRAGEDEILKHIYSLLNKNPTIPKDKYFQLDKFKIAAGPLGQQIAVSLVTQSLTHPTPPTLSHKSNAEEMRETLTAIAEENRSLIAAHPQSKTARFMLYLTARIQLIFDMLRDNQSTAATMIHAELNVLSGSSHIGDLRMPQADDFAAMINPADRAALTPYSLSNQLVKDIVTEMARGNIFAAKRIIDKLQAPDQLWQTIPSPIDEATKIENGQENSLPKIAHYLRYAYCFLNSKTTDFSKADIRDLKTALEADSDNKQLFLSLKSLPPAIRNELLENFRNQLAQAGEDQLAEAIRA